MKHTLAVYAIYITEFGTSNFLSLSSYDGSSDLFTYLLNYFKSLPSTYIDHESTLKISAISSIKIIKYDEVNRCIYGRVESGEYGAEHDVVNRVTQERNHFTKDDATVLPFYFMVQIPEDSDIGLVILQRIGSNGIKSSFIGEIIRLFNSEHQDDYSLRIDAVTPDKTLEKFYNKEVSLIKIRLEMDGAPSDVVNTISEEHKHKVAKQVKSDIIISAKRNQSLSWLKSDWDKRIDDNKLNDNGKGLIIVRGFENSRTHVTVKTKEGDTKELHLHDIFKIRSYVDLSDLIDIKDGHPGFDDIHSVALKVASSSFNQLENMPINKRKGRKS